MRVSSSSFADSFMFQTNQLENQQNTLQSEATTGLNFTQPGDDPAGMTQALELQADSSSNTQYQSNITQLQDSATTSYDALNGLQTLISQASTIAAGVDGTTSTQELSSYATEIGGIIQQALQLANTQDSQGNYIFGGTNASTCLLYTSIVAGCGSGRTHALQWPQFLKPPAIFHASQSDFLHLFSFGRYAIHRRQK